MELLKKYVNEVRVPLGGDRVYKEECAFSFDTPESKNGLYVCMKTFLGLGKDFVEYYSDRSKSHVFLHLKHVKEEIEEMEAAPQPTRLAIGIEGGFNVDSAKKYSITEINSVVILPSFHSISLPCADLPNEIQSSVAGILGAESVSRLDEMEAMSGMWDGEKRQPSKHAEILIQLSNGIKIPPTGWKCEKCDKTQNLWLNLTDGSILCGRKFFDGSGGNNHAIEHYQVHGYPLAVKLGTITPNSADVFSYAEDEMVEDPFLEKHLSHFGIDVKDLEKTDKSMIELEIDMNQRIGEWAIIQESGSLLIPVYGAGYTGMANLGNSCYLNSVMQVIFCLPDFKSRYFGDAFEIFSTQTQNPVSDFNIQLAKLACGLWSGKYSKSPEAGKEVKDADESQPGIKPIMFKYLIGKGHPEFSTKRQQDAMDFLLYFLETFERNVRGIVNPAKCLEFQVEERLQCKESNTVKYLYRSEYHLPLQIPLELATNKDEVRAYGDLKAEREAKKELVKAEEIVRAKIPFSALLQTYLTTETVPDFFSSAVNKKTQALKSTKLKTFPDFLLIQLKKFTLGTDWVPMKLDVSVDMPDTIDLSSLRGHGLQPTETEMPEKFQEEQEPAVDVNTVSQLAEMGFSINGCRKAVYYTKNSGVDAAMAWVIEHMNDPDFDDVSALPSSKKSSFQADLGAVTQIVSMGYTTEQATAALKMSCNNIEAALEWIFSKGDDLDIAVSMTQDPSPRVRSDYRDGSEKYKLVAFISHMGKSTMVGHYVCHILKEGRWIIYNDNKVAVSENPPKDLGYLYLYQRM